MKAKEYFEKYFSDAPDLTSFDSHSDISRGLDDIKYRCLAMTNEMLDEVIKLSESRGVTGDSAFEGVVREINQKYNVVGGMLEKKYNMSILKRNGFEAVVKEMIHKKGN